MKQIESDVVVVAAGPGGLAAAVTAAEGRASVVVLEKAPVIGGLARPDIAGANGFFAVESKYQKGKLMPFTKDEAFKFHMDFTHWRVDARLVRAYIDKSVSTIEWLEKLGLEFTDVRTHNPGCNYTWHIIKGPEPDSSGVQPFRSGAMIGKILTRRAEELGVKFLLETPANKLIKENGSIVGVMAKDSSGEEVQAKAKAVIIATGGFSDNPEMIKKYIGLEWGHDLFSFRMPGLAGEGVRMAWEVGAAPTEMIIALSCGLPVVLSPFRHAPAATVFHQPNLTVNLLGERFMNEEIVAQNPAFAGNAVVRQKNGCGFMIFDSATVKHYMKKGFDWPVYMDPSTKVDHIDEDLKQAFIDGDKHIVIVNSLEELTDQTGIKLDALCKTVDEYNIYCENGRDPLFNKDPKYLRPVKQPEFYVGKLAPAGFGSQGGIKINYKAEVLTKDHDVIPGLYAVGADANSIYGDTYIFALPGNMLGFALNSGRIAGENALAYIKSISE